MFGFGDLDADLQEDIQELLAAGRELPTDAGAGDDNTVGDAGASVEDMQQLEAAPDAVGEVGEPPVAEEDVGQDAAPAFDPMLFVDAAVMDANGYITCALPPFDTWQKVGRITVWPPTAPPEKQNCAIRYFIHARCSFTRRRRNVTDRRMMEFLFRGGVPRAGGDSMDALRASHASMAAVML